MTSVDRYALLAFISKRKLPALYDDPYQVDLIRSYVAAGLLKATIVDTHGTAPQACVSAVTREGLRTVHTHEMKNRAKRY